MAAVSRSSAPSTWLPKDGVDGHGPDYRKAELKKHMQGGGCEPFPGVAGIRKAWHYRPKFKTINIK